MLNEYNLYYILYLNESKSAGYSQNFSYIYSEYIYIYICCRIWFVITYVPIFPFLRRNHSTSRCKWKSGTLMSSWRVVPQTSDSRLFYTLVYVLYTQYICGRGIRWVWDWRLIELFNYDRRIKTAEARARALCAAEDNKISFESLERGKMRLAFQGGGGLGGGWIW